MLLSPLLLLPLLALAGRRRLGLDPCKWHVIVLAHGAESLKKVKLPPCHLPPPMHVLQVHSEHELHEMIARVDQECSLVDCLVYSAFPLREDQIPGARKEFLF